MGGSAAALGTFLTLTQTGKFVFVMTYKSAASHFHVNLYFIPYSLTFSSSFSSSSYFLLILFPPHLISSSSYFFLILFLPHLISSSSYFFLILFLPHLISSSSYFFLILFLPSYWRLPAPCGVLASHRGEQHQLRGIQVRLGGVRSTGEEHERGARSGGPCLRVV
jgi:hypothetical protein